jgi:hypothetical protein
MPYQVVWPKCNVFSLEGERETLQRGQLLPGELDAIQVENLATIGAVSYVEFAVAPVENVLVPDLDPTALAVEPAGFDVIEQPGPANPVTFGLLESEGFADLATAAVAEKPDSGAPKAEWVKYAQSQGVTDADTMTKAELVQHFGS